MEIKSTYAPEGQKQSTQKNLPLKLRINHYLFPPHLPPSVQLLRMENLAIPACYFVVGSLQGLSGVLMNVYPIDLGATEAQQITISGLRGLPASFKLVFGFISDGYLLFGYRRKSYMALGWGLCGGSMLFLYLTIKAKGDPNITFLSCMYFLFGLGFWYADVMADSVVAEKAKLEPEGTRGSLQSTCYAMRFFALMVFSPISTWLYSSYGPTSIIFLMGILPLVVMLPLVLRFREEFHPVVMTPKQQCNEIWKTVCSRAVWQPMGFVYLYNVLQVGNAAWKQYLVTVLEFTSVELNSLLIASYVLLYVGVMSYKYYFIKWSWRKVYIFTTTINGFLSGLQILLIFGVTFGLGNFWFALGDDAMAEFIAGIQFLPTTIMMVHLCPVGSEGASYAMFTTVHNAALNLSQVVSTLLLGIWPVGKAVLEAQNHNCLGCLEEISCAEGGAYQTCPADEGSSELFLPNFQLENRGGSFYNASLDCSTCLGGDAAKCTVEGETEAMNLCEAPGMSGFVKLTLLTTALQISGLLFVKLLPGTREELMAMNKGTNSSRVGGFFFLTITGVSLLYSVIAGMLNIVSPGWSGES
ncbi:hypothetical protein TrLO_g12200 [Triparma laevis f. longispina]|uniref:Uncharacterized protein n=1 Tax=Triparma laevis f. longispina TaxID=1714387 RepID=A0A9W6ZJF9_9STRA|nr:hypothetical protein TrLO_g12200 [Triparma laevis f. longispina]